MGLARYFHETDKRALMKDCKAKARRVIAKLITVPHHILMVAIAYRAFFEDSASSLRAPFRPTRE